MSDQLALPQSCPRCGRRVQLDNVGAVQMAHQIDHGINHLRLAIPDRLKLQVRTLTLTLPCLLGVCSKEAQP